MAVRLRATGVGVASSQFVLLRVEFVLPLTSSLGRLDSSPCLLVVSSTCLFA